MAALAEERVQHLEGGGLREGGENAIRDAGAGELLRGFRPPGDQDGMDTRLLPLEGDGCEGRQTVGVEPIQAVQVQDHGGSSGRGMPRQPAAEG